MVSTLTRNTIGFLSPLLMKSFAFLILANRAVALFTILFIVGMALGAVCFSCVYRWYRSGVHIVFINCYRPQMGRINAVFMTANMVNNQTFGNVTDKKIVRNPMRSTVFFLEVKRAISIFIKGFNPNMALSNLVPLTIKPIQFFLCKSAHNLHYTPLSPLSIYHG